MFELFFKYPPAVFRNGEIVLLGGWPLWVLGLALAAAGAVWARQLLRPESRRLGVGRVVALWTLQTTLAALVLLLLWRPAVQVASSRPQQNVVAVMVDTSRSMSRTDGGGEARIETVRRALDRLLPELSPRFRVRLYAFSDRAVPVETLPATADGAVTALGDSVASVLRESRVLPMAAVVVLSDGADHSRTGGVLDEIGRAGIPVHTVGVGPTSLARDLELFDVTVPVRTPAGSRVRLRAEVRHQGLEGRTARLTVSDGRTTLATRDVALARGRDRQSEELYVPAGEPGAKVLVVTIEPQDGEEVIANNRLARPLQVESRRARVLYVEGEPRWELKFVRRAVTSDKGLELVTLLRTSANKVYRQGVDDESMLAEGFPSREEDLFAFDALVIGNVEAAYFTAAQHEAIRTFADRRGGGVLFLGGRRALGDGGWAASPTAELLPVRLSARSPSFHRAPVKAVLTSEGRESPLCLLDEDKATNARRWESLPELADYQESGEPKPGATILLAAQGAAGVPSPLLAIQSYGRGRSAVFATGGSWRWRMGLAHEDASHATFWRQLLRGLVSSAAPPLVASSDRSLYADDPRVTVRAEVRSKTYEPVPDAAVWATIADDAGNRETVDLTPVAGGRGLYEGVLQASRPGLHRIEVQAQRGDDDLGRQPLVVYREDGLAEEFHPEQDAEALRRLAGVTGGRHWPIDALGPLPGEIAYSGSGITVRETLDLWDMPSVFLLALALRLGEWWVRRAGGRL